jgi:hypothetical protein
MVTDLQRRLNDARSAADEAADKSRRESQRCQVGSVAVPRCHCCRKALLVDHVSAHEYSTGGQRPVQSMQFGRRGVAERSRILLQGLEAEKNLLAAAEARAAGEAAEHFRERCRLSAELEAAHKIHTAKCAALVLRP